MQAVQWFKNGDHPEDRSEWITAGNGEAFLSEGNVVRRFRRPHYSGVENCAHCGMTLHHHGWIDNGESGRVVCPGNFVVTINDNHYAVPEDVLEVLSTSPPTPEGNPLRVIWNPPWAEGGPRPSNRVTNPWVRPTSYGEVSELLGTSGCSIQEPHWDWSVMGVIPNAYGREVVVPGDWIEVGTNGMARVVRG